MKGVRLGSLLVEQQLCWLVVVLHLEMLVTLIV